MNQVELLSKRRAPLYNCAHFACDLWEAETGNDIRPILTGFLAKEYDRHVVISLRHSFERLKSPISPCIVLFRRVNVAPHVGVFLRGRVSHLTRQGVIRQPVSIASIGYTSVRYYAPS